MLGNKVVIEKLGWGCTLCKRERERSERVRMFDGNMAREREREARARVYILIKSQSCFYSANGGIYILVDWARESPPLSTRDYRGGGGAVIFATLALIYIVYISRRSMLRSSEREKKNRKKKRFLSASRASFDGAQRLPLTPFASLSLSLSLYGYIRARLSKVHRGKTRPLFSRLSVMFG